MKNTLEQLLSDSSFVRWLKDEASPEDEQKWEMWLREDPEHRLLVREAKQIVVAMERENHIPDPNVELEKLDQSIDRHERKKKRERLMAAFSSDYQPYRRIGRRAVAAAILMVVMLSSVIGYYFNGEGVIPRDEIVETPRVDKYHTDYGEKLTFRLSDGSRIMLNGNSTLVFSSTVEKGLNTEVQLEGEAYFNIARLEDEDQRTFTVQTDDGAIQVLGTRFAVNTFREETKAVLEEGSVTIQSAGSSATYELAPGQLARFKSHDNKIAIQEVNTALYTSWREGKLRFAHTPRKKVED